MQTLTEKVFELAPPGGLFDETVIGNLFPDGSDGARSLLVHRACGVGEVLRLKRGLFVLAAPYRAEGTALNQPRVERREERAVAQPWVRMR